MARYAENTAVPADRSRVEIEKTISRYGAEGFGYGWHGSDAMVTFEMDGKHIRFKLTMPDKNDPKFYTTATGRTRKNPDAAEAQYEKATRQRWRALALVVKAKLEAVDTGITTFEEEFLAHIVIGNGRQTLGEALIPQMDQVIATGSFQKMLGMGSRS